MEEKAYIGIGMEGVTARWYERNTAKDMAEFHRLACRIAGLLPVDSKILEVAPGPGFLSIELAKRGFAVTGLDISKTFVDIARKNAEKSGVDVHFEQGNASKMPFADQSFNFLVCRAAFKNFANPAGALREMHRVLKSAGRGLIIDLRRDASMADIRAYVDGLDASLFNRFLMKLLFHYMLLPRAWPIDALTTLLGQIPFRRSEIVPNNIGMEVWLDA